MKKINILFWICTLLMVTGETFARTAHNSLIVYGSDFAFQVKEPKNWKGDIDNASKFGANIIFYQGKLASNSNSAIISIRVNSKVDENTADDLAYDMKQYKAQYKDIKFKDISVLHPSYRVFPKLFYRPELFYEYVTYLNPGEKIKKIISASMHIQKREATSDELMAYKNLIQSISFLTDNISVEQKKP